MSALLRCYAATTGSLVTRGLTRRCNSNASSPPSPSPLELLESLMFPRRVGSVVEVAKRLETIQASLAESGVLTLTLNRPKRANALNMPMWRDLFLAFDAIKSDSKVRAVILTGSETAFSSGMDLGVFMDIQALTEKESCQARKRESLITIIDYFQRGVSLPEQCAVPVIAAISGQCIGGAVDLVTACDIRLCTETSDFSVKEIDLAIVADIGTLQRLPRLIGDQQSRDLSYTGRHFSGKEAASLGLCLGPAYATHAELIKAATEKAEVIATKSPLTIRGVKKSILFSTEHSIDEGLQHVKLINGSQLISEDLVVAIQKKPFKKD